MRWLVPFVVLACLGCKSTPADLAAFKVLKADLEFIAPDYLEHVEKCKVWPDPEQGLQRVKLIADMRKLLEEKVK